MESNITACRRCGVNVTAIMRFCPSCGSSLTRRPRGYWIALGGVVAVLLSVGIALQITRQPPRAAATTQVTAHAQTQSQQYTDDPQIAKMRSEIEATPEDLAKLRIFAGMLGDKLRADPGASSPLVFEAIDVLGRILKLAPNDPGALVMMADVSFDQRAFTKSLDFYERYLKLEPQDLGARARYASTLTFLGRFDDSITELNSVLKSDPNNFPAMAYLAITYAQSGDTLKAKELGVGALKLAPSDDARARFSAFVSSLDGAADQPVASAVRGTKVQQGQGAVPQPVKVGIDGFIAIVRANPIAGPKFVQHEASTGGSLRLIFRDFPMQQMPPFAKEKFFSGLRKAATEARLEGIKTIIFVDAQSGSEMESLAL